MKNYLYILLIGLLFDLACRNEVACENYTSGELKNLSGLDGCQWVIELTDGSRLELVNLGEFDVTLEEGKRLEFTYKERKDMSSICMIGTLVELTCLSEV
jgi:hypothetical protein